METSKSQIQSSNDFVTLEQVEHALIKQRKRSTIPDIDTYLAAKSMNNEIKFLRKAKQLGVNVPGIIQEDEKNLSFKMELLEGTQTALEYFNDQGDDRDQSKYLITRNQRDLCSHWRASRKAPQWQCSSRSYQFGTRASEDQCHIYKRQSVLGGIRYCNQFIPER